jgi:hypothetical protein
MHYIKCIAKIKQEILFTKFLMFTSITLFTKFLILCLGVLTIINYYLRFDNPKKALLEIDLVDAKWVCWKVFFYHGKTTQRRHYMEFLDLMSGIMEAETIFPHIVYHNQGSVLPILYCIYDRFDPYTKTVQIIWFTTCVNIVYYPAIILHWLSTILNRIYNC